MFEAELKLTCKNPELVKSSLEPDIKNDEDTQTVISVQTQGVKTTERDKNFVVITIKSKKLSHLKAIINSYLATIAMLNEITLE